MSEIILRPLTQEDCQLLFNWRNDPWIISLSASQRAVEIREHQAWFSNVIARQDTLIRIISNNQRQDMGLVRIVRDNELDATITIYLMQLFVDKKRGQKSIRQSCSMAFSKWQDLQNINAWIRRDNTRSIAAFSRIGFREKITGAGKIDDGMIRMQLERDVFLNNDKA